MNHFQRPLRTVARIRVREIRSPPGTEHIRIRVRDGVARAVHGAAVRDLECFTPAQEIGVLKVEIGAVAAARPSEGDARTQGPDILGDHLDIDFAVGIAHRQHAGVVDIGEQAQGPLGLGELAREVFIAGLEKELGPDACMLRSYVQAIGKPKQAVGLARVL